MSTTSPLLKLILQDLDENPDTWGTVLNVSVAQILEDSIAGAAAISLLSTADYTLDVTAGGPSAGDHYRHMILDIGGSPGGATNIIVPALSKVYLAANSCGSSVTVKTAAGTGIAVPDGSAYWVFCDGTDVQDVEVATAVTATSATTATNATQLGGVVAASYARLDVAQNFTQGQNTTREVITASGGNLSIDCSLSNSFYHLANDAFNLTAPTNASNGQQFSLIVEQGSTPPNGITFQASTFMFEGGVAPTLSTALGAIDYLAFEYVTGLSALGGARWVGSIIKNVSTV
jgi:hypothetical protein